jgi:hypothetical protein
VIRSKIVAITLMALALSVSTGVAGASEPLVGVPHVEKSISDKNPKQVKSVSFCDIWRGGKHGRYICEYGITDSLFQNRYHTFVVGTDRGVWFIWETSPGGSWSNWTPLGAPSGGVWSAVVVVVRGNDYLQIRVLDRSRNLFCRVYTPRGGWSGWHRCR